MGLRIVSGLGLVAMVFLSWLISENRRVAPWRLIAWGIGLQFAIGVLMLKTPFAPAVFAWTKKAVDILTDAANEGSTVVFGALTYGFTIKRDALVGATSDLKVSALMAFQALPIIILVSAISSVLYHVGVIQVIVRAIAWCMRRTLKTSGAETLSAALQILAGIESMPVLRGYLKAMTRSELCTTMTTFMATIAGSVMVLYATFGARPGHLLAASLMSAPAAILISKLLVPEGDEPLTRGTVRIEIPIESHNIVDAAARGTSDGLSLALNVGAMVIAFVGGMYLLDLLVGSLCGYSFTRLMGFVFRPFAFLLGIPAGDVATVGELLGKKTVLNELLAYADFKPLVADGKLSPRSVTIATYALCGFANPGSLGICIAAMTGLAPERRKDIVQLGLKALVGGTLANFTTACVAGILVYE